jgi:hypothetical protein
MGSVTIDPKEAVVDLDLLTLTEHSVSPAQMKDVADGRPPGKSRAWYFVQLSLEGGFDRVPTQGAVAEYGTVRMSSHLALDDEELSFIVERLRRWYSLSMPLRYLEFGDSSLIIEDTHCTLRFPPGLRELAPAQ